MRRRGTQVGDDLLKYKMESFRLETEIVLRLPTLFLSLSADKNFQNDIRRYVGFLCRL